jgi:hypothetical protein
VNEDAHHLAEQATVHLAKYPDVNDGLLSYFDAGLLFALQRYEEAAKMYERVFHDCAPRQARGRVGLRLCLRGHPDCA